MPELKIDDRVIYKIFRDKTYYVVGFESRHPQSVRIGERGPSGRMVEISPAYCSVILQRMQDMELDPQRVTHGA